MNPVVVWFLDGTAFVAGNVAVAVACGGFLVARNKWMRAGVTAVMLAGMVVVVASGTPLPVWVCALWLGLCVLVLGEAHGVFARKTGVEKREEEKVDHPGARKALKWSLAACAIMSVTMLLLEHRDRREPRLPMEKGQTVYVIGDSISAGTGKDKTWPTMLAEKTGLKVVNLARAGATAQMARKQAESIKSDAGLVIVEIGGNDLLGKTSAAEFEVHLDALVEGLRSRGFGVMVIALPCVPFKNGYGRALRRVTDKHGAAYGPRSLLVDALGAKGGTSDGLHLSEKGHEVMAEGVRRTIFVVER